MPGNGLVPTALKQTTLPSCPKCERCGCGLVCDPGQMLICSTCAPAEIAELRAKLKLALEVSDTLAQVAADAEAKSRRWMPS